VQAALGFRVCTQRFLNGTAPEGRKMKVRPRDLKWLAELENADSIE
jgi:hypothetical protein